MTLKGREFRYRDGLLLELVSESGATGLGETSPLPGFSPETLEGSTKQLSYLASSLPDRELTRDSLAPDGDFSRELDGLGLEPSVRFGVELALWNLHAASESESLLEVLCGSSVSTVPLSGLLGGSVEEVLSGGYRMREAGYEVVKLKVGSCEVEEDVELVRALVKVLGRDVALRIDANRAWSSEEAAHFVRALDGSGYEYIEEPLSDPSELAGFVRDHGAKVALDESLVEMAPEDLQKFSCVRAIVIKPTMVGGISRTLRLAEEGRRLGIKLIVSSAYETGVGTKALLVLSAATGSGNIAAGLDTYRRLGSDVLEPPLGMTAPKIDVRRVSGARHGLRRGCLSVVSSSES